MPNTLPMFGRVRWPPVLCYHAIAQVTEDPHNICVSPKQFEKQILYLYRHNLRGVSVHELINAMSRGNARGLVGITFDDAYRNFLQNALPVLERFGFSCTVFASSGMLGGENSWDDEPRMKLLDVEEVREISKRGIELGSHGKSHIKLSNLDPKSLEQEVNGSRQLLCQILSKEVQGFCYPYANLDKRVIEAVQRAGYTYACVFLEGVWWNSPWVIPRIFVSENDNPFRLRMKLWVYATYMKLSQVPYTHMAYALINRTPIWRYGKRLWSR